MITYSSLYILNYLWLYKNILPVAVLINTYKNKNKFLNFCILHFSLLSFLLCISLSILLFKLRFLVGIGFYSGHVLFYFFCTRWRRTLNINRPFQNSIPFSSVHIHQNGRELWNTKRRGFNFLQTLFSKKIKRKTIRSFH